MDEIKINMIEKTDEGLVLKLPTTSVEQVKGLKSKLEEKVDNSDLTSFKKENETELNKKVNKEDGKGLSTNDYTDLEKAEVAKIKNLATNETVAGIKSDVENLKTSKVDKVSGKGLSTNDYNNTEKAEVAKVKDKADKTYVDEKLADKATVTDLTKKIDKTSITSDLEGTDENKVLSQKAGNLLSEGWSFFFTSVNEELNNKADRTDLDLKIDKTSITSDLAGTDETKVLSQKAGNFLESAIKNIDLSGKIDKSSITNSYTGTSTSNVLSQKGANDLFSKISENSSSISFYIAGSYSVVTFDNKYALFTSHRTSSAFDNQSLPSGLRPLETISIQVVESGGDKYSYVYINKNGTLESQTSTNYKKSGVSVLYEIK